MPRLRAPCPVCEEPLAEQGGCAGCGFEMPEVVPASGMPCARCGENLAGRRIIGGLAGCGSCGGRTRWPAPASRVDGVVWMTGRVLAWTFAGLAVVPIAFVVLVFVLMSAR